MIERTSLSIEWMVLLRMRPFFGKQLRYSAVGFAVQRLVRMIFCLRTAEPEATSIT
jgi:hypothetical protein